MVSHPGVWSEEGWEGFFKSMVGVVTVEVRTEVWERLYYWCQYQKL